MGVLPVSYGEGLVERVRALEPDGVTVVLDLVGGEALEVSPRLLAEGGRLASVIDPVRVRELDGSYWSVRPDADGLAELARLVDEGQRDRVAGHPLPCRRDGPRAEHVLLRCLLAELDLALTLSGYPDPADLGPDALQRS